MIAIEYYKFQVLGNQFCARDWLLNTPTTLWGELFDTSVIALYMKAFS